MAVRRPALATAISDLIEEFGLVRGVPFTGKAYKILRTILQVIVDSLRRGEPVKIAGFGTFSLSTRKAYPLNITYFQGGHPKRQRGLPTPRTLVTLPPKVIVKFTPSKTILRELNRNES